MNNAGLPGTGLGGLFYILLALWMPVAELRTTLRGESSAARWRMVGAQFALACGIVVSVALTVLAYVHVAGAPRVPGMGGRSLAAVPVVLPAALLAALVVVLRVLAAVGAEAPRPASATPPAGTPARPARHRAERVPTA